MRVRMRLVLLRARKVVLRCNCYVGQVVRAHIAGGCRVHCHLVKRIGENFLRQRRVIADCACLAVGAMLVTFRPEWVVVGRQRRDLDIVESSLLGSI